MPSWSVAKIHPNSGRSPNLFMSSGCVGFRNLILHKSLKWFSVIKIRFTPQLTYVFSVFRGSVNFLPESRPTVVCIHLSQFWSWYRTVCDSIPATSTNRKRAQWSSSQAFDSSTTMFARKWSFETILSAPEFFAIRWFNSDKDFSVVRWMLE